MDTLNQTLKAWTYNYPEDLSTIPIDDYTGAPKYSIYSETQFEIIIYNQSETVSQVFAPIFYHCTMGAVNQGIGTYEYVFSFGGWNMFALSGLNTFLNNVFKLNALFQRYTYAVQVNDVNMQLYNIGRMINLLLNFDVIDFKELDDPSLEWDADNY